MPYSLSYYLCCATHHQPGRTQNLFKDNLISAKFNDCHKKCDTLSDSIFEILKWIFLFSVNIDFCFLLTKKIRRNNYGNKKLLRQCNEQE